MGLIYVLRNGNKATVYKTKNGAYYIKRSVGNRYLTITQIKSSLNRLKSKKI